MPYRPRSTDLWFNAPGIVAAYQPVACPAGELAARINVANEQRTPGRYAAAPGVAPTHNPRHGWTFNGTDQYLLTGIVPTQSYSIIVQYSNAALGANRYLAAIVETYIYGLQVSDTSSDSRWLNRNVVSQAGSIAGNMSMSNFSAYFDGIPVNTIAAAAANWTFELPIGCRWNGSTASTRYSGNIQAVAICSVTLSPSQVWQYSRQMAHCHVNPDWNAWGRRRRYYYAPSVALAGAVHISPSRTVGGDGGRVAIRPVRWYQ